MPYMPPVAAEETEAASYESYIALAVLIGWAYLIVALVLLHIGHRHKMRRSSQRRQDRRGGFTRQERHWFRRGERGTLS